MNMTIKQLAVGLGIGLATLTAYGSGDDLRNMVELFRSDVSAAKKETIIAAMQLTEDEAKVFWPIYREYEVEFAKIGDERVALIENYIRVHTDGTMDNQTADDITEKSFNFYQKRFDLWKKYHAKISKALSPVRAAEFLQLEHQASLLIDIGIASELPLIGANQK